MRWCCAPSFLLATLTTRTLGLDKGGVLHRVEVRVQPNATPPQPSMVAGIDRTTVGRVISPCFLSATAADPSNRKYLELPREDVRTRFYEHYRKEAEGYRNCMRGLQEAYTLFTSPSAKFKSGIEFEASSMCSVASRIVICDERSSEKKTDYQLPVFSRVNRNDYEYA